ncbi:MarR family transcriptional regulator [Microbacterium sp. NPDC089188]|uniref:MarR family winged helix-turn-helix transcriptional regulator n=1 Tax=Microbacterium sp. NPDC089188 TaxID=3154971 RepID=UPI003436DB51
MTDQIRVAVSDIDLTETQAAVLRELETPLTQRQIADALSCEPSNVTFVINKLENHDLVVRTPHPRDRRVNVVALTDAGRKARTETIDRVENSSPLAGLRDSELDQLEALLAKATGPERA